MNIGVETILSEAAVVAAERAETIPKGSRVQVDSKSAGSVSDVVCSSTTRPKRSWPTSKYPNGCVRCGFKDTKHAGHGLCSRCYFNDYASANREHINALAKEGYHRNKDQRRKTYRERWANRPTETVQRHKQSAFERKYAGQALKALEQAQNKCERCGYSRMKEVLEIHHRDCDRENNNLDNLEVFCPTCHKEHHYGS